MPIGKMAQMNHVSIATLRLYDEKGLLKPRYVDENTGYRYYSLQQNARLDIIAYMKELGMSLAEIADVLSREDITLIEDILARKNVQIHQQINELYSRHDAVERAIHSFERYRKSPLTGTMALEFIDRRYAWGLECANNFYAGDLTDFEEEVIPLREAMDAAGIRQIHTYNIATSIKREDFVNNRYIAKDIFVFLGRHESDRLNGVKMIDSGMYACIYLDGYDGEEASGRRLHAWCEEKGYTISGDYICEVMTEFNVFDDSRRNMFLRLQVPVSFDK